MGRDKGIGVEKLQGLNDWRASNALDAVEKLVIEYAEEMSQQRVDVPEELFERLRAQFSPAQLVELTDAIAWENYRARFNRALLIASDELAEGAFCMIPARAQLKG